MSTSNLADPALTLPTSERVASGVNMPISGVRYQDSFAAGNPGQLYLSITDSAGKLTATNSAGLVPGSGSNAIALSASYADLTEILSGLTYTAPLAAGTETISFDIWDQAGIETTGTIPITITSSGDTGSETWTGAVSSDWNTPGNWSGGAVPASGDMVGISGGAPNSPALSNATLEGETITLSNGATASFTDVQLDSVLQATGSDSLQLAGTLTIGSLGTFGPARNGVLLVSSIGGGPVPIVNEGTILAPTGGNLSLNNGGTVSSNGVTIENNGGILAEGGQIDIDFAPPPFGTAPPETLSNTGSIEISNGGKLTLNGTVSGHDVTFNGAGRLGLQQPNAFANGASVTGFGQGDAITLYSTAIGQPLAYSNGILAVGTSGIIPLPGQFGLGNFVVETAGSSGGSEEIAYAPDRGPSGIDSPDISTPAAATVHQGNTLSLGDVALSNAGTVPVDLSIEAGSGTLYMNAASGSGTNHLSLNATPAQINADLTSLIYVPMAGANTDTITVSAIPPAPVETTRWIPLTISGGGPVLNEPVAETVSPDGTVAVNGCYADSFAQGNPGQLFLGISAQSGTLTATDASGNAVAGSGTNSIALSTDYVDVNAILASLRYTAASAAGSDQISFDVWNQAGVETTGATVITIDPPSASEMTGGFPAGIADTTAQPATSSMALAPVQQDQMIGVLPIGS